MRKKSATDLQSAIAQHSADLNDWQDRFDQPGLLPGDIAFIKDHCAHLHHELRKLRYRLANLKKLLNEAENGAG